MCVLFYSSMNKEIVPCVRRTYCEGDDLGAWIEQCCGVFVHPLSCKERIVLSLASDVDDGDMVTQIRLSAIEPTAVVALMRGWPENRAEVEGLLVDMYCRGVRHWLHDDVPTLLLTFFARAVCSRNVADFVCRVFMLWARCNEPSESESSSVALWWIAEFVCMRAWDVNDRSQPTGNGLWGVGIPFDDVAFMVQSRLRGDAWIDIVERVMDICARYDTPDAWYYLYERAYDGMKTHHHSLPGVVRRNMCRMVHGYCMDQMEPDRCSGAWWSIGATHAHSVPVRRLSVFMLCMRRAVRASMSWLEMLLEEEPWCAVNEHKPIQTYHHTHVCV